MKNIVRDVVKTLISIDCSTRLKKKLRNDAKTKESYTKAKLNVINAVCGQLHKP